RIGEYRDHSGSAVAMLAEVWFPAVGGDRFPRGTGIRAAGVCDQRARSSVAHAGTLRLGQPSPSSQQRDHVPGIAVDGTEPLAVVAVEILGPERSLLGLPEIFEQAHCLLLEEHPP